jgi:hypothetical protein
MILTPLFTEQNKTTEIWAVGSVRAMTRIVYHFMYRWRLERPPA